MNKFVKGDRVRIITNEYGEAGKLFVIDEIEGSDDVAHETPYRNRGGYWYKANDLVMVQPAYAKEYAIGKDTEPLARRLAAVDGLAPLTYDVYQDAPANAMGLVQGVDEPLDGETFHEWVAREGRRVEDAAFYWKQIAADNMELGSRGMDDRDAQIADLRSQLAAVTAANTRLANALEPFAEAWLQVPLGLRSVLRIWNGELDEDSKYPTLGSISTDTLQDAHTAYFGLPEASE